MAAITVAAVISAVEDETVSVDAKEGYVGAAVDTKYFWRLR